MVYFSKLASVARAVADVVREADSAGEHGLNEVQRMKTVKWAGASYRCVSPFYRLHSSRFPARAEEVTDEQAHHYANTDRKPVDATGFATAAITNHLSMSNQ
jgi:hypothetical protein